MAQPDRPVSRETRSASPLAAQLEAELARLTRLKKRTFVVPESTRVITVANQKGGVGKTTTAVNLAVALAQAGMKVLVIDNDPQGNASTALGVDHHADVLGVYDVLTDGLPIAEALHPAQGVDGVDVLPATIDLAGAEIELVMQERREYRLREAVSQHCASHAYDFVFIDCPPSLGILTLNAFVAADEVLIPVQCEYYALEGLSQLLHNIDLIQQGLNPRLRVSTMLLTMYDGRTNLSAQVAAEVRQHFPELVLKTAIPRSVRISEAPSHGLSVLAYDASSPGALSYREAAQELSERGAPQSGADHE